MRILWMGDPHVQKSNLEESKRLAYWTREIRDLHRPDHTVIAGDLYNDFGTKRVEVDEFWTAILRDVLPDSIVLEGNHDQTPDGSESALAVHEGRCFLVRRATMYHGNVGLMPFVRDNDDFLHLCQALYNQGARVIFCHADVNGAQYENGFYSPHGADISGLPKDLKLISGHIHKQQEFGNVWFPGTPRHLTRSDVGEQKGLWLIDTVSGERQFFPTPENVATPFRELVITPENAGAIPDFSKVGNERLYVDVHGTKDFVSEILKKVPETARVRTFVDTGSKQSDVNETDGIPLAFMKYAAKYAAENNLTPEVARKVLEKVYAKCPSLRINA